MSTSTTETSEATSALRAAPQPMAKAYDPAAAEVEVTKRWNDSGMSSVEATGDPERPTYSIVIPPPNVTAALHLGHALNNTLQDVLIRYHRMLGHRTLWMPGTDHAGIATQTVVEKRLLAEGVRRLDMGREAFVAKTQEWKDEYEAVIIEQLKAMGASCDWERTRFTMDEVCVTAVRHAFYELFRDGLIYRGKRLVNWDPATRTALSDDEVEMETVAGHMWYLRYPLLDADGAPSTTEFVTVATTRPETMLGDTAVAINPDDPRAEALRGRRILLPIVWRTIPLVEDDYVVMADPESTDAKAQFASGFLKVTPAHDPNDWDIGVRHDLPVINVMGPDGGISDQHGWDDISDEARALVGLSREDARAAIVAWFDERGLLEEVRDYEHSVGHSYRSHVPIEPWLSDQWFVAVTDDRLRGEALRAQEPSQSPPLPDGVPARTDRRGDGELTFHPDRYARTYHAWHDGIRDWCISRQLWWGHQIPVWMRLVPAGEAAAEIEAALDGVGIDEPRPVTSRWTEAGGAHLVRRVTELEIEEAVCVPPEPTLARADRADSALDEAGLIAALEADGFERDPDVLDTWFSSGLWPLSTMGWPWPEDHPDTVGLLDSFNPTSVLMTAREIITLWVSRMTMFNRYFLDGQVPFDDVFIHAMIQDGHGQKMSKSLGNGVDPRDIIHSHGADALRYTLVQMTTDTQDVRMPVDMICPHSGETFTPEMITTAAGHVVAAPIQTSPADPAREMVSAYGDATGTAKPSEERPLARNTSSRFDAGRNFANKVWNATRFAIGRIPAERPDGAGTAAIDLTGAAMADRWIVARLGQALATAEQALERYQFNVYADTLYDFIWRDVCDRYLEAVKPTIDDNADKQAILAAVLDAVLRVLHPVCPFVTEALWPHVRAVRSVEIVGLRLPDSDQVATATWPILDAELAERLAAGTVVETFERADRLVGAIRALRAERNLKPRQQVTVHAPATVRALIDSAEGTVETLAGVGEVLASEDGDRPAVASTI
ncbi:MAG: valine--tRNA ligase, partial [Actinomycetota bacterium]